MKNLFLTMTVGLILLTSCSKDESFEQIEEQSSDSVYVLKQSNGTSLWESTLTNDLYTDTNRNYTIDPSNYAHTEGNFISSNRDLTSIVWTGTENSNRTSGSAEVQMSTPYYSLHFIMETECVRVDGDEAVYGGIITEVIGRSGNAPSIDPNWRFYFKVIDMGRGSSQIFDKISNNRILASPRSQSLCNIPVNDSFWSTQGYEEVRDPGYVEVSNSPR